MLWISSAENLFKTQHLCCTVCYRVIIPITTLKFYIITEKQILQNYICVLTNGKHSSFHLCRLPRAGLSHQHKGLVPHQDVSEALSVLAHRQLQPLPQYLMVAWRVGQVGEGVDLLLRSGGLLQVACAARHPGRRRSRRFHISFTVPVPAPAPWPFVAVPVTSARGRGVSG